MPLRIASPRTRLALALGSLTCFSLAACAPIEAGTPADEGRSDSRVGGGSPGSGGSTAMSGADAGPMASGARTDTPPSSPGGPTGAPANSTSPPPAPAEPGVPAGPKNGIDYSNPQIRVITPPENITSLIYQQSGFGRFHNEQFPIGPAVVDVFALRARNISTGSLALFTFGSGANWDVGSQTGFRPTGAPGLWQRGRVDAVGNTAFQLQGTGAGTFIDTATFDRSLLPAGSEPTSTYSIEYSNPVTPYLNATSELTVQGLVKVPTSAPANGGYGQVYFVVVVRDRTSNHTLEYASAIWDSRPTNEGEVIVNGGQNHIVVSPLRPGMRYSTVSIFSAQNRNQITWSTTDFFRLHIPRAKLIEAASTIQAETGAVLSKNAADYVLVSAGIRTRTVVGSSATVNMRLGMSLTEFGVYEFH